MSDEILESQGSPSKKKSHVLFHVLLWIVVIVIILGAAGAAWYFLFNQGGAVAVVNGQNISRFEYDKRYSQLATAVVSQGGTATTTEAQAAIKNQTLDNLISETLILQLAEKDGVKVNEQAVDEQMTQNKTQFTDEAAFEKALTDQGFTEKTFRETLVRANIIQQYLTAHIDVSSATATETEIQDLYDSVANQGETVPPLEEVREQIKNQIIQQKQQQLVNDFVQQLRGSSTVETLI